ncbi:MAG TPA: hypothetical protein VKG82_04550 [Solirubrobacteraceae bacterium]|nr:hypothetical protein [Solirubrobacteraceae bacterium]
MGSSTWLGVLLPVWIVVMPSKTPAGRSSGSVCRNKPDARETGGASAFESPGRAKSQLLVSVVGVIGPVGA